MKSLLFEIVQFLWASEILPRYCNSKVFVDEHSVQPNNSESLEPNEGHSLSMDTTEIQKKARIRIRINVFIIIGEAEP